MKIFSIKPLQRITVIALLSLSLTSCQIFPSNVSRQESQRIPTAQMSQTVDLRDGDTYELTAASVKKVVG